MQFRLPCWKNFAKNLKSYRPNCEIQLEKCFLSKNLLPLKTILWTRRVLFWRTSQKKFAWSPKKIGIYPIEKPRNQWSSDYRAGEDLPKNLKIFRLKCETQFEKCVFFKEDISHENNPWTGRVQFWQTTQ